MPFITDHGVEACPICGSDANVYERAMRVAMVVNCSRCGDYRFESREVSDDANLPITQPERCALVSYLIRQMNGALIPISRGFVIRPTLTHEFFNTLDMRSLPSPIEATDNLLLYLAKECGSSPGKSVEIEYEAPEMAPTIGVVTAEDVQWAVDTLSNHTLVRQQAAGEFAIVTMTLRGWGRVAELQRAEETSCYAFFARKFDNPALDMIFERCLVPAVRATGFELRTVTQRAGLVDAIIENEIRRCAFLLADLSDDNAGAYWEAGFAEGLGKPVIYVCKMLEGDDEKRTHFDANHRHTVRWDLATLDETEARLIAVIRNTLPGRAK